MAAGPTKLLKPQFKKMQNASQQKIIFSTNHHFKGLNKKKVLLKKIMLNKLVRFSPHAAYC
jgi:hypothetical protein